MKDHLVPAPDLEPIPPPPVDQEPQPLAPTLPSMEQDPEHQMNQGVEGAVGELHPGPHTPPMSNAYHQNPLAHHDHGEKAQDGYIGELRPGPHCNPPGAQHPMNTRGKPNPVMERKLA